MNERQKLITAALDALQIPLRVQTIDDRKALQKAIYLAQEAGLDFGYPYGWHQVGPYSSQLAEDYQEAAYASAAGTLGIIRPLRKQYRTSLESLRPVLEPPTDVQLSKTQWLELLASLHFLRKYVGQSEKEAHATLHRQKRPLAKYTSAAALALARVEAA